MSERSREGRRLADDPIAIVGVSSLFPMARNHREYWQNIVDGTDCISEVPESRWHLSDYYDPDPAAPDKTYSRRGGFIPDVEFSPIEFGLPPNQLDVTSTMQTLSLGVARDLLADAGAPGSSWYDPARTGVVLGTSGPVPLMHPLASRLSTPVLKEVVRAVGLSESDAEEIAGRYVRAFAPWEEMSFPGLLANVTAGRIANRFDLGGLNSTVDAACAASLSAVRLAIAELIDRRADTMITGGVDMENTIFVYLCFSKVGALSRTDRVSPLSSQADGTLMGEGVGMLALRRLADAERDGNRIYAVIRGIGASSDGRAKSIYAPRSEGQRIALRRAYDDADCSPASVGLFEAHATGTAVGDKTELTALSELLTEHSAERHYAAVGSVKSQIGHTKGAAGAASLIKLALSLYHKTLPPTINVDQPNNQVDFTTAPFYVNVTTRPWIRDPRCPARRAAVSAMGFGGTNFHLVLEEHHGRRATVRNLHRTARAHLWHAPDPAALAELLASGAPSADGGPVPAGHARVGLVATGPEDAAELRAMAAARILDHPDADAWSLPRGVYYRRSGRPDVRVGALFAGQGSQYLNMGAEAALNVPPVGEAFDDAEEAFTGRGARLASVVFPPSAFDPQLRQEQEARLRRTEYAQPAIGALSVGQFRFLRELGLECVSFAGHSFGELTALWAAGSLTTDDYYRLAAARGAAMAAPPGRADSGTMAAITADRDLVAKILAGVGHDVVICNHNAPDQVVVGGGTADVEEVVAACAARDVTARRLPVSAAFHTGYVAHAGEAFRTAVSAVRIGPPNAPVHANSPGASYGAHPAGNAETLIAQLLRPVEFVAAVEAMRADGVNVFVEFGPKQVLTGLVRRILGESVTAIAADGGPLGDADVALKQAAVQLAVLGVPLAGINRYDAPPPSEAKPKGMTVTLNGAEYVSPARRARYADGLADGFRVTLPPAPGTPTTALPGEPATPATATTPSVAPRPQSTPVQLSPANEHRAEARHGETHYPEERLAMTAYPAAARPAGDDPAAQHLALHARYLESQLQVAEALLGLVSAHGLDHPGLPRIAETVKDQSVAIGNAHARAGEVLARLTELERGAALAAPGPAGAGIPGAAVPAPVPGPGTAGPGPLPASVPPAQVTAGHASLGRAGERYAIAPAAVAAPASPRPVTTPAVTQAPNGTSAATAPYAHAGYGAQTPVTVLPDVATVPGPGAPGGEAPAPTPVTPAAPATAVTAPGVDAGALRAALIAIVAEKTGYPPDLIDPAMDLEADLGVDSIKRVQVIGAVQEQFTGLPAVGPEQLSEMRTLDHVVGYMVGEAGDADPKALPPAAEPDRGAAPGQSAAPADAPCEPAGVPRHPVGLVELPPVDLLAAGPYPDGAAAVLVHHGGADAAEITAGLAARGWSVRQLELPASEDPGQAGDPERAFAAALAGPVNAVVLLMTDSSAPGWAPTWAAAERRLAEAVLLAKHAQAPLTASRACAPPAQRAAFVAVTRLDGALGLAGPAAPEAALLGGVAGVVKTLAIEAPELFCRALDIDPGLDRGEAAAVLLDELRDAATDTLEVGVDGAGARRTITPSRYHLAGRTEPPRTLPPDRADEARWPGVRASDVFLVTGGGRGITALCTGALAALPAGQRPAEFILLGRTELADEPDWAAGVADSDLKAAVIAAVVAAGGPGDGPAGGGPRRPSPREAERRLAGLTAQREIRATLNALAAADVPARYLAVDVADAAAVRAALAGLGGTGQRVTGVIHGAGVLADALLADKTPSQVRRVLRPKLGGLAAVLGAIDPGRLRHLVLFTSVAGLLGNAGQADYAAANEALARFAASWRHRHPAARVVAIDWGAWDAGMVTPGVRALLTSRGARLLDPAAATRAFAAELSGRVPGGTRVLLGPDRPLSSAGPASRPVLARRTLAGLADDPVIKAHRIGDHPVLPATFGLGWLINVAERAHPGTVVVRARNFQVFRGIVFDGTQAEDYETRVEPLPDAGPADPAGPAVRAGRLTVRVTVLATSAAGRPVPHFGALLELAAPAEPADRASAGPLLISGASAVDGAMSGLTLYATATLFHAPRLQVIREILEFTGQRLAVRCRLADAAVARGAFHGALHSPVLTDVLSQGASVLSGRFLADRQGQDRSRALPLAVATADYHAPLPSDEDFYVVFDHPRAVGAGVEVDATATGRSGQALVRFTGMTLVATPDMAAKFASAVVHWRAALEMA